MDILDTIKQFINESIQSLFVKQKEDFSLIIHKEMHSAVSELKTYVSQHVQANERDMANMQQMVFSLKQEIANVVIGIDALQESLNQLEKHQAKISLHENDAAPMPSQTENRIYYAKMVDSMTPLGFKIDNLKNTEDGCAFKITIKNDLEGYYQIIDDQGIQQEVMSAFNPLISDSSIYGSIPQTPTQITIVQPGTVVKENQIFRIVNKQIIEIH